MDGYRQYIQRTGRVSGLKGTVKKNGLGLFLAVVAAGAVPLLAGFTFSLKGPIPKTYTDVTKPPYNAIPNDGQDDSVAFQSALNDLKTAGGGSLYIPDGGYRFDSIVTVTNSAAWGLTIRGQSTNVCLYSNNTNGIFRLAHTTRKEEITIRDLSLIANVPGAGTAVEVTSPQGGANDKRILTMDNVQIRYYGTTNFFTKGVVSTGIYRPLISNCSFLGPVDAADMSDQSLSFSSKIGFDMSDCYAPVVENCSATGVDTAYNFVAATNAVPEDGAFRNCTADSCKTGIRFQLTAGGVEPTLWVTGCEIKARDTGVWITGRRIFHITGSTFRQLSPAYALQDVRLEYCHLGLLIGNTFAGELAGGRRNVTVDQNGLDLIFAGNSWSAGVGESVLVDAGAQGVFVY